MLKELPNVSGENSHKPPLFTRKETTSCEALNDKDLESKKFDGVFANICWLPEQVEIPNMSYMDQTGSSWFQQELVQ